MTLCTSCGLPILAEHHDDHHPHCPNHTNPGTVDCTCDIPVHPWCCDTCKETAMSGSPFSPDPGTRGTSGAATAAFLIAVFIIVLAGSGIWTWLQR